MRFGEEEDDIARLVIGIAARNNEYNFQVITSLTNALMTKRLLSVWPTPPALKKFWPC